MESPAAYKRIHRFLKRADPRLVLRLLGDQAEFVIGDPREPLGMARLMNKRWVHMEKMLALLVYADAYLIGERL